MSVNFTEARPALSHDWLNGMRGGEKCLEVLCEIFPQSPIFTLFHDKRKLSDVISSHPIQASFLQRWPGIQKNYRHYLPFFSGAIEGLDTRRYNLIVSTSHCVAKGIRKAQDALHICYCFTPVRYVWGFFDEYFGDKSPVEKWLIKRVLGGLKAHDLKSSGSVDHFVAISHHIRKRIESSYQREAEVIYPPVDTDFYTPDSAATGDDFYLVVSALVPYKRVDLAVNAFNEMGKRLVVIGDGPEKAKLEKMALPNVTFMGWKSDEVLRDYYRRARALVFPGEEDFGIVPLEMQACGGFVIAYQKGGALETIMDGKTGTFFSQLSTDSLREAVRVFEKMNLNKSDSRNNALRFSRQRFKDELHAMIRRQCAKKGIRL